MNRLFAAALELQRFFESRRWRYCFIDGLAVQRWGEPRLTLDVDCTLLTGFGAEAGFVDSLLGGFAARLDRSREFALTNRVLLLRNAAGVPLDIALGAMPYEERCVERASAFDIGEGESILTCSAEDLIVFKAFAGRERDWLDVDTTILRQREALDVDTIWRELLPLLDLDDDPATRPRLEALLARVG
jgi:hypothetical protein